MSLALSKNAITSYLGDVLPLHLGFDSDEHDTLARADIKWASDSDAVALRTFSGDGADALPHRFGTAKCSIGNLSLFE